MPKDLLSGDSVKYEISGSTHDISEHEESNGEGGPQTPVLKGDAENASVRILLRTFRSVPSINSNSSSTAVRLRHRMHSASVNHNSRNNRTRSGSNLERNERSANLSHITSKIQLFIKNRLLQILPDGTVNGTQDDSSDYSEYQPILMKILCLTKRFWRIRIKVSYVCMFLYAGLPIEMKYILLLSKIRLHCMCINIYLAVQCDTDMIRPFDL